MDNNISFDLSLINLFKLKKYNNNKDLINKNKEELWFIVNQYLEAHGANRAFLNKPAVIERIKRIIFKNLLLGDNTQICNSGAIIEKGENYCQQLGICEDGKVMFYRQYENKKRIVLFDVIDGITCCRFFDFDDTGYIPKEKRVYIDEYGFDYYYEDLDDSYSIKNREIFQNTIVSTTVDDIIAISDNGNCIISPMEDDYFFNRDFNVDIDDETLLDDYIEEIKYKDTDTDEVFKAYPKKIIGMENIDTIKRNYAYYTSRYQTANNWYINRYGKKFLINNGLISNDCSIPEPDFFEKTKLADEMEIQREVSDKQFSYSELVSYAKEFFLEGEFNKAIIFISKMSDEEKLKFINEDDSLSKAFYVAVLAKIKSDKIKQEVFDEIEEELDIEILIPIIETFESEDIRASYYEKYIDSIIEHDNSILENYEEENTEANNQFLSERVLDSLSSHDNLYNFLNKLKSFSIIKYNYIKDFTAEEIQAIIEDMDDITQQEYGAIFNTRKLDDDTTIDILERNWNEGLYLSRNDNEYNIGNNIYYSLKVIGLLSLKDRDKKIEFLEEHVDDYGADEITEVLKDIGDSTLMLSLAKKFGLTKYYYYDLVVLCDDDKIFECMEDEKIDEDDLITLVSSVNDMPKAFNYVENLDRFTIMQKIRILSFIETDLAEEPEVMKQMKINFLKKYKNEIISQIKDKDSFEDFEHFIKDFEYLEENEYIEDFKKSIPNFDDPDEHDL